MESAHLVLAGELEVNGLIDFNVYSTRLLARSRLLLITSAFVGQSKTTISSTDRHRIIFQLDAFDRHLEGFARREIK